MKKIPIKKIINWIIGIILSIYALGYFLAIPLIIHINKGNNNKAMIIGITIVTLIGLLLLPIMNLLIGQIKKKFPKIPEKAYFFLLGVVSLLRCAAIVLFSLFVYGSNYLIMNYVQDINPLPVSKTKIASIENFIKSDKRNDANRIIQSIPHYEDKLDLNSFKFLSFKRAYNQAISDTLRFTKSKVLKRLNKRFDFIDTRKLILSFGEMDPDTSSVLKKYSSVEELAGLSLQYADFYKAKGDSGYKTFLNLAKKLAPSEPQLLLYSADAYAQQYNTDKALEEYKKYINLMEKNKKESKIPKHVNLYIKNKVPSEKMKEQLYQCYFSEVPSELFYNDEKTVSINKKPLGAFQGHLSQLVFGIAAFPDAYYSEDVSRSGFLSCFASFKQVKSDPTDISFLESISGIEVYQKSGKHFKYINPEIIQWAQKNIVPKPNDEVFGVSFQSIYNTIFKNFTREFMYAYWYTERFMNISGAAMKYEEAMTNDEIWMSEFIYEKFIEENRLPHYYSEKLEEGTLSINVGTLIRRYIDGSYTNCVNALDEIVRLYDEKWYNEHTASFYPQEEESYDDEERYYGNDY